MTYETTGYLLAGLVVLLAIGFGGITYFYCKGLQQVEQAKHEVKMSRAMRTMLEEILERSDSGC